MKHVSYKIALAIKRAGYPQGNTDKCYLTTDHNHFYKEGQIVENEDGEWSVLTKNLADIPTYIDVWLWLWREKNIQIHNCTNDTIIRLVDVKPYRTIYLFYNAYGKDPEEAVITAIEYIVNESLLK